MNNSKENNKAILNKITNLAKFGVSIFYLDSMLDYDIKNKIPNSFLILPISNYNEEKPNNIDAYNICYSKNLDNYKFDFKISIKINFQKTIEQNIEMLKNISRINPYICNINFDSNFNRSKALECIILTKEILRDSILMLDSGRKIFNNNEKEIFDYGINAITLSDDYNNCIKDIEMIKRFRLKISNLILDRKCIN